jgi:hypothetical protein
MLEEFPLGREAVEYIHSELRNGRGLARNLAHLPLDGGRVVTYLQESTPATALLDFGSGGVAIGEENAKIAQLIKTRLMEVSEGTPVTVVETLANKGDRFLRRKEWPRFVVMDEVYAYHYANASVEEIRMIVREAHWYPAIGVASSLPPDHALITDGEDADPGLLRVLAERTDFMFIGAYDAEAWLVWRRS